MHHGVWRLITTKELADDQIECQMAEFKNVEANFGAIGTLDTSEYLLYADEEQSEMMFAVCWGGITLKDSGKTNLF